MYCPSCGRFFPGEGPACELCGAAIPGVPSRAAVPRSDRLSLTFTAQPNCNFCGAQLTSGADQCPACGQLQSAVAEFAGFWRRFAAYLLDQLVIFAIFFGLAVLGAMIFAAAASVTGSFRLLRIMQSGK